MIRDIRFTRISVIRQPITASLYSPDDLSGLERAQVSSKTHHYDIFSTIDPRDTARVANSYNQAKAKGRDMDYTHWDSYLPASLVSKGLYAMPAADKLEVMDLKPLKGQLLQGQEATQKAQYAKVMEPVLSLLRMIILKP